MDLITANLDVYITVTARQENKGALTFSNLLNVTAHTMQDLGSY
jgi:hypothetical protein